LHVPTLPAWLQDSQVPLQASSQHTPCGAQNVDWHSMPAAQVVPLGLPPMQTPPMQVLGATQLHVNGRHCVLPLD
jgi:hypothetical protein